ncbi:hypothetical protein RUM44_011693 [Polyplax serrata]|uniref:Uncharacterized protein n=1 Tax=Polyplax serrata TaxID=468196 RepID=A0ABR1AS87_POLSC
MGTVTMPSPSHHHHHQHQHHPSSESSQLYPSSFIGSTNFPDTFQDFFAKLSEPGEDNDESGINLLEDKQLLPPKSLPEDGYRRKLPERHWSTNRKSLRRRANEMQRRGSARNEGKMSQQISLPTQGTTGNIVVSPMVARRRSSSIGVTRVTPDLNRFLQTEQQRTRSQVKHKSTSPEPNSTSRPVSPRPPRHSPLPLETSYSRNRTASMPVVTTRSRVSQS